MSVKFSLYDGTEFFPPNIGQGHLQCNFVSNIFILGGLWVIYTSTLISNVKEPLFSTK